MLAVFGPCELAFPSGAAFAAVQILVDIARHAINVYWARGVSQGAEYFSFERGTV